MSNSESPAYYAQLYQKHGLEGGHVIKLGKGNDEAARDALHAWPRGLQIGGGITEANVVEIWQAGADSAAIISDLLGADDVPEKVKRILALR